MTLWPPGGRPAAATDASSLVRAGSIAHPAETGWPPRADHTRSAPPEPYQTHSDNSAPGDRVYAGEPPRPHRKPLLQPVRSHGSLNVLAAATVAVRVHPPPDRPRLPYVSPRTTPYLV